MERGKERNEKAGRDGRGERKGKEGGAKNQAGMLPRQVLTFCQSPDFAALAQKTHIFDFLKTAKEQKKVVKRTVKQD